MLEPIEWPRFFLGLGLFLVPGFTWSWALLGNLPWLYRIPIAVVAAFTLMPALVMALHLMLGVPLSLEVFVFASALLAVAGAVFWIGRHAYRWELDRFLEKDRPRPRAKRPLRPTAGRPPTPVRSGRR